MADVIALSGDGDEPDEPRQDTRSFFEIMEPEGARGSWREMPRLFWDSLRLRRSRRRRRPRALPKALPSR